MDQRLPMDDRAGDEGTPEDAERSRAALRLLGGLNPAQRNAVLSDARHLRIIAGAGSGKTRVLTHRIAHRILREELDPGHVLTVTFTRKAASELRSRLARLGLRDGVTAGTFHAIAMAQLRARWSERDVTPPDLLTRKVGFVGRLITSRQGTEAFDVVAEIEWAKARMITPERYEEEAARHRRRPPAPLAQVARTFARYEEEKRRKRMVDFDDLLRLAARDLRTDTRYASARHWRFRHLFVDEFQDVNPLQFELLSAWLGPTADLCVVGDPNQAIYAWNGADARYLSEFDRYFPEVATVTLADNYRSTPQILTVANGVLAAGGAGTFQLRPNRPDGPLPHVTAAADERDEATLVARAVRDRHRPGRPWSDQAILVRTNAQAAAIEEALNAARIPFRTRGGANLLEAPEVRHAMTRIQRRRDLTAALEDLESGLRAAEPIAIAPEDPAEDIDISELPPPPPVEDEPFDAEVAAAAGDTAPVPGAAGPDDRAANIAELVRLGREFLSLDPVGTPGAFTAWLIASLRSEDTGAGDAVEIATFHAAKGLEWNIVHVAGLEEGFVPIHHASTEADLAEEQRLLYVALTRAREELRCSWARTRAFGSRTANRNPSRWIEAIESTAALAAGGATEDGVARGVGEARDALNRHRRGAEDIDAAVLDRLRRWRRDQARVADVRPSVILGDTQLREVARRRPRTTTELLEVPGLTPVKVQRFGEAILRTVQDG